MGADWLVVAVFNSESSRFEAALVRMEKENEGVEDGGEAVDNVKVQCSRKTARASPLGPPEQLLW